MKKAVSLILALVMLCTLVPMSSFALNEYVVYGGQDGCRLLSLQLTQADNAWLLYDIAFDETNDGRVLTTAEDHPGLVGASAILDLAFEGDDVYFNGTKVVDGEAVKLNAENELVVVSSEEKCRAEYVVNVTEESNGLPIVLIDTDDVEIATKLEYVGASISILGADVYGAKDIYSAAATAPKNGIKLRGNSTMGYDKKPYRIKFDSKQNVLGMGKAKSWVLLANYLDPSAMRNQVAFNLADRVNKFTAETTGFEVFSPRMKPVEVYLNGEFKGLYDMGDHMQANELRVAINELGDEKIEYAGEEIGYFIEVEVQSRVLQEGADGYADWSAYSWIEGVGSASGKNQDPDKTDANVTDALYFQFKLPEEPTDNQKSYITEYMQEVNDLILERNDAVWDLIDMDSVIDWYLVNEIFKNADSQMQSSIYFYKDGTLAVDDDDQVFEKTDPNTKLYMAPVWDFDLGAGGVSYGEMDDPTSWRTRNDEYCGWFRELFEMDSFKTALETRWANLHEEGILEAMFTDIDELTALFAEAAPANYEMWHQNYVDAVNNTDWLTVPEVSLTGDWNAQISYLENWLDTRIAWMDEQYGYTTPTTNATQNVDAVLFENEVFTAPSAGKVSQTYVIDELITLDMLAYDLDITANTAFDFGFDATFACTINGEDVTINLTPTAKGDWQSAGNVFDGETGKYIAAGTYNDRVLTLSGALKWRIAETYLKDTSLYSTINLEDYVNKARLNSVKVTFENATAGNTATFSLTAVNKDTKEPIKIDKTVISGKPLIMGEAKVGNTLTVSNVDIAPFGATLGYQWYRNGSAISGATDSTYKVTASDLGKSLTVKATAKSFCTGTATSKALVITLDSITAAKAAAPTLSSITTDTIVVATRTGYEYSLNGKTWQTSGVFSGLTAGKAYNVYARVAATSNVKASEMSDALIVVTDVLGMIKGDINTSGTLDTTDAVLVLEQALEFIDLHDVVKGDCDFNGDGKINTSDARAILRYIVGK